VRANLEFISLSDEALAAMERRSLWLEFKVFRHFQLLFTASHGTGKHLCHLVVRNLRGIAEAAASSAQIFTVLEAGKFFNTLLRFAVNKGDVKLLFTILEQLSAGWRLNLCGWVALETVWRFETVWLGGVLKLCCWVAFCICVALETVGLGGVLKLCGV
jgi:hypothetical protein